MADKLSKKQKFLNQEELAFENIKTMIKDYESKGVQFDKSLIDEFYTKSEDFFTKYNKIPNDDLPQPYNHIFYKEIGVLEQNYITFNTLIDSINKSNHPSAVLGKIKENLEINIKNSLKANTDANTYNNTSNLHNAVRSFISINFFIDFFGKLNFPRTTTTILGANGVGKSTLLAKINEIFTGAKYTNLSLIPGQKLLSILPPDSILSQCLVQNNTERKTYRNYNQNIINSMKGYNQDSKFSKAIMIAIGAHISQAINQIDPTNQEHHKTLLQEAMDIWNSFIDGRELFFNTINRHLQLKPKNEQDLSKAYDLIYASDGEKVLLYYILDVLLADENTIFIIDEPETHLHKAILNEVWDKLEAIRSESIFIYLTHDPYFAKNRSGALFNLKQYMNPTNNLDYVLDIIPIPKSDEIPAEILVSILGSDKPVIFCEGSCNGDYDEQIYKIVYGEKYTIKKVGGCSEVITFTKYTNSHPELLKNAIGIIDRDQRSDEKLEDLKEDKIYHLKFSEIENLLLHESILSAYWENMGKNKEDFDGKFNKWKGIVFYKFFTKNKYEALAIRFATEKLKNKAQQITSKNNNTADEIEKELATSLSNVFKTTYTEKMELFEKIETDKDYDSLLLYFNHKGMVKEGLDILFNKIVNPKEIISFLKRHNKYELAKLLTGINIENI